MSAWLDAVAAAVADSPRPVEVSGDGPASERVRSLLGVRAAPDAPGTIVVTTGSGDELRAALARVADLGTIVLAGPVPASPIDLDVYADLHVRGLTLVGLAEEPDA